MPLKSEAQRRFLHAAEARGEVPSGLAEKYENATPKSVKAKLPMHVKKHATVMDLMKAAEPDPDRDRQADDEGHVKTDKEEDDGHGAGVKGKKMNTVKDLLKKKADDQGAALGGALQGVRDNAKKTMGAIKPPASSLPPAPKPLATPGMPAEKKAEDAGAALGDALQGVKVNAKKTMGAIKPTPAQTPKADVKMGPPQGMRPTLPPMGKAASAFTHMPNRKDGMFFTKAAGRKDGMFFKQAMEAEGAADASTGDAMASNEATGAVGSGMGHGKGLKVPAPKKAKAA